MCPILDGYGVMGIIQFPYTPSCEPRLTEPAGGWRTQLGGLSFALQALFFPPDSAVHNRAAAYVAAGGDIFENQL